MEKFFKFIGASTSITGMFLCLFGITAFVYMLFGIELDMQQHLNSFSTFPNPLEFIQQGMKVFNWVLSQSSINALQGVTPSGNNIFTAFFNFFKSFINIFYWIGAIVMLALYVVILLPVYFGYFVLKCLVIVLGVMGFDTSNLGLFLGNWNIIDYMFPMMS